MKAAVVEGAGESPVYGEFPEPTPSPGRSIVSVHTAALSNLVRARASGTHYSSEGRFPFVAGVDGVGRLENGQRVYFVFPDPPFGAMAERAPVPVGQLIPLPDDLDDVTAAAVANPGMSSWAALRERAKIQRGESVLINGATGTAGRLSVQIARHLGARRVVATGRNVAVLNELGGLGADRTIPLGDVGAEFDAALEHEFREEGIDIVLDYLWGPSAERILIAGAKASPDAAAWRFVHVGALSGANLSVPGVVLRSSGVTLMGSGIGSIPPDRLIRSIGELLRATRPAGLRVSTRVVPFSQLEQVWGDPALSPRVVFEIP